MSRVARNPRFPLVVQQLDREEGTATGTEGRITKVVIVTWWFFAEKSHFRHEIENSDSVILKNKSILPYGAHFPRVAMAEFGEKWILHIYI